MEGASGKKKFSPSISHSRYAYFHHPFSPLSMDTLLTFYKKKVKDIFYR